MKFFTVGNTPTEDDFTVDMATLRVDVYLCSTFLVLLQCIISISTSPRYEPHDKDEPEGKDANLENPVLLHQSLDLIGRWWRCFLMRRRLSFSGLDNLDLVAVILEVLWMCIREEFYS